MRECKVQVLHLRRGMAFIKWVLTVSLFSGFGFGQKVRADSAVDPNLTPVKKSSSVFDKLTNFFVKQDHGSNTSFCTGDLTTPTKASLKKSKSKKNLPGI